MNFKPQKGFFLFLLSILFFSTFSCKQNQKNDSQITQEEEPKDSLFFKLSLAEWSLHQPIMNGELDPMDFAQKANEMGFQGIEYVNSFYADRIKNAEDPKAEMQLVLDTLKMNSEKYNVQNVLIMVDGEGDLADNDTIKRNTAVDNHKKWVDAAAFLGCHSIRVNLFGSEDPEIWVENSTDALKKLSAYASEKDVNVLVENHGYLSSNADLLVKVMQNVNMENCGTLPDFGNFCLKREGDARWDAKCVEEYPRYEGVQKMMPYAKAVSAKSYDFNEAGEETTIEYKKILQIVKNAGYDSFIGVEYEGSNFSPEEGIMATKELLIEAGSEL